MTTPKETETTAPRRLHPMTMLYRLILAFPGFLLILVPVLRSGDTESWLSLYFALAAGLIGLPIVVVQYRRFRYWITPKELIIHSGVITRKHRNIPIERIQNVEIVQRLLPRLFQTAKVNVVTAGSTKTEGVLEYVSLREAQRIRQVIRSYKAQIAVVPEDSTAVGSPTIDEDEKAPDVLYKMSFNRVLLSGVFRFSLFYIAIIFSTLQIFEPNPERLIEYIESDRFSPFISDILTSPAIALISLIIVAASISWISGILVNVNKHYGFRLHKDGPRIYKKSGLLTVSEGTIPLTKIQALIRRTNPIMRRFDWWSLSVQTMGHDVSEQRHSMAIPFGSRRETIEVAKEISSITFPSHYLNVSKITIRRMTTRLTVLLILTIGPIAFVWTPILWAFFLFPVIVAYSYLRYRNHGYSFDGSDFSIRRGVIKQVEWSTSLDKFHVFYLQQSIFQKRHGLKTLYIDTAGASPVSSPAVVDIPAGEADALLNQLYEQFQERYSVAA